MRRALPFVLLFVAACRPGSDLEPIPHPEIAELEDRVRVQLGTARAALEGKLERGGEGEELGQVFGNTGMLYHAYDLREAAAACYRNAGRLQPDEFRWAYYLGHVYVGAGDLERGREAFARALEIRPGDTPALVRLARLEMERDRADLAGKLFERVLDHEGNRAAALVGLGKIAAAGGDYEAAVRSLEEARGLAPQATKIHHPLGMAYRGLGNIELAERFLGRRGEIPVPLDDPWIREIGGLVGGMRVNQIQGTLYFQEGQYEQALTQFRRAVEEDPDEPLVRANLALTLIHTGDLAAAEREFVEALRLAPDDPFANYNYATLLTNLERDEAAVEHFVAAIDADPGQYRAHLNLANTLARLGRHEESLPHYRSAVEGEPGNATARVAEARVLARLGRWGETRRRLEQAQASSPDAAAIRFDLARVLAAAPDDGVRDGRRAVQLTQPLVTSRMPLDHIETLAMIAAENGLWETAIEMQQGAVDTVGKAGLDEALSRLQANLERYRAEQPCREPWPRD